MKQLLHTCSPRNKWPIGRAVAMAALLTFFVAGCEKSGTTQAHNANDDAVPTGTVQGVDTAVLAGLLESAKGRIAVVNLWATWCVPCVVEMPELAEFYREHSRDTVAFFAVSLDDPKEVDGAVKKFMTEKELPFPAYVLTERDIDAVGKVLRQEIYGALPTTIVYDRTGAVKKMWEGAITLEELNAVVKPLL